MDRRGVRDVESRAGSPRRPQVGRQTAGMSVCDAAHAVWVRGEVGGWWEGRGCGAGEILKAKGGAHLCPAVRGTRICLV